MDSLFQVYRRLIKILHTLHTIAIWKPVSCGTSSIWWISYIFISWLVIKKSLGIGNLPNSFYFSNTRQTKTRLFFPCSPRVICFALSFMETLGQGGAGTCKSIDFLWHKPTAPCQNNEFLSTPHHPERMWFYMQSEPEVCAGQWWGKGSLHLSPRRVGTVCIFSCASVLFAAQRGDPG